MTKQAAFKRRVRARMAKTGESYAIARSRLLSERPATPDNPGAPDRMAAALHISNGDATDLAGTGLARRIVYWRDVLHEGPVPAVGREELRRMRAAFLIGAGADDRAEAMGMFRERDAAVEANRGGEYVLWFEADLYDQLQIVEILARLAALEVPAERITLICIGEHPGIARFGGLGQLRPDQLAELPATRACATLTPAALDLATRAWAAFRAPTPDGLPAIAADRSGELRFLGEAFERLSREYPSTRDGLSLTERRILAATADAAQPPATADAAHPTTTADAARQPTGQDTGPRPTTGGSRQQPATKGAGQKTAIGEAGQRPVAEGTAQEGAIGEGVWGVAAGDVFVRASAREARPYLGDDWCFAAMDRLARAPYPLLETRPAGVPVEHTTLLRLTATGARVLAGEEDHVALNGIDRWIGGVHLTGRDVRWRWDEGREALITAPGPRPSG